MGCAATRRSILRNAAPPPARVMLAYAAPPSPASRRLTAGMGWRATGPPATVQAGACARLQVIEALRACGRTSASPASPASPAVREVRHVSDSAGDARAPRRTRARRPRLRGLRVHVRLPGDCSARPFQVARARASDQAHRNVRSERARGPHRVDPRLRAPRTLHEMGRSRAYRGARRPRSGRDCGEPGDAGRGGRASPRRMGRIAPASDPHTCRRRR